MSGLWDFIIRLFGKKGTPREYAENERYTLEYGNIDSINYSALISNKLSKYITFESEITIEGENQRAEALNMVVQRIWKEKNKIVSRALGTGGTVLYPYITNGIIEYHIVAQNRLSINQMLGGKIVDATIMADIYKDKNGRYYLWVDLTVDSNNVFTYKQRATFNGSTIPLTAVEKWAELTEEESIANVDRVLFGYVKSPIDNRRELNDYGVPITYGCRQTIIEIKDCLKNIVEEYDLKEAFLGIDSKMIERDENGKYVTNSKKYEMFRTDKEEMFEIFSPEIRETSYYSRLNELYKQLEKQIGLSQGILTEMPSFTTATQFKKALFDTLQVVGDVQDNVEDGMEDFVYACNVLMNYANLTPAGDYVVNYEWSYTLAEDYQEIFNNDMTMLSKGLKSKAEVRAYQTGETTEKAQKIIDEIEASNPTVESLLGSDV